jgi:hypothetical protein
MNNLSKFQSKIPDWMKSDLVVGLLTLLLWVISVAFSFYVMAEFQQMILRRYAACCADDRWEFHAVRQWSTIFLVGIWLAFTIITGEYHYQHRRKPVSQKVFKWSFLVLLVILALALIL